MSDYQFPTVAVTQQSAVFFACDVEYFPSSVEIHFFIGTLFWGSFVLDSKALFLISDSLCAQSVFVFCD